MTISHAEAAQKLGVTRPAFDVACHRFRQRFGKALREEICHTVGHADDVDEEIQYLLGAWTDAQEDKRTGSSLQTDL